MPYGIHKGVPIDQVPPDYLGWCLRSMDACDPDHERFWPEFRVAIVSVIGEPGPNAERPRVLSIRSLCERLATQGIKLQAKAGELVTSETVTDTELRNALRVHRAILLSLVAIVESRSAGNGSAKLLWAADLRCRVKAWYGRMSRQFHPDTGGSPQGQTAVNQCYRSLMAVLQEWEVTRDST
jgi:hypothetical protein